MTHRLPKGQWRDFLETFSNPKLFTYSGLLENMKLFRAYKREAKGKRYRRAYAKAAALCRKAARLHYRKERGQ